MIRSTIAHVAPEFTMNRMIRDYIQKYYLKMYKRTRTLREKDYMAPKELAYWKRRILESWKAIKVVEYDFPDVTRKDFTVGATYSGKVILDLDGLSSDEIGVEMVFTKIARGQEGDLFGGTREFKCTGTKDSLAEYTFVQRVDESGAFDIGIRIYPKNELLPHRMDFPLVRWI
jgi:hypothetical protein